MDHPKLTGDKSVRLSGSPAGSPRVVHPPSPTRSVHLMADPSMNDFDFEMRTQDAFEGRRDFFEDSSEDELETADELGFSQRGDDSRLGNRRDGPSRNKRHTVIGPNTANYAFLCNDNTDRRYPNTQPGHDYLRRDSTTVPRSLGSSPYNASVEDLKSTKKGNKPRPSSQVRGGRQHAVPHQEAETFDSEVETTQSMADQILGAHAITLQALLRDEEALDSKSQRTSNDFKHRRIRSASLPAKKVSMVPPLINNTKDRPIRASNPTNPKTPYPFQYRKTLPKPSPLSASAIPARESVLTLSIRRHGNVQSSRVARVVIPPMPELEANPAKEIPTRTAPDSKEDEKSTERVEFDDAALFNEIRCEYRKLSGVWRLFSARVLKRITVGQSRASSAGHASYPRSPQIIASQGLPDIFSEDNLMEYYHSPKLGRLRHTWVHWAIRLATSSESSVWESVPSTPSNGEQVPRIPATIGAHQGGVTSQITAPKSRFSNVSDEEATDTATLEFVEGWSVGRICFAMLLALLLSAVGVLLWTFFGTGALVSGFRGAGARVGTAVLIGVLVLMLGWTIVLGWMALSWILI